MTPTHPSPALAQAIADSPQTPHDTDKLQHCRDLLKEARDTLALLQDLEERRKTAQARYDAIRTKELVDLFQELGIRSMSLDAEGNNPPVDAKLKPFYRANIAADWPDEKRAAAFVVLNEAGGGDLIKRTFISQFGKGKDEQAKADDLRAELEKLGVPFNESLAVSWQTLTAWFKEMVEKQGIIPPLEPLGATMGHVVEIKEK